MPAHKAKDLSRGWEQRIRIDAWMFCHFFGWDTHLLAETASCGNSSRGFGRNLKNENQLNLSLPEKYLVSSEKRGEFTGERLSERKPELYRACVRLLGDGTPYLSIAKLLGISVNTVAAVKRKEKFSIESLKREQSEKYRLAGALAGERAIEMLSDDERAKEIPLNQLAIASGIFTEKAELLSGGATRNEWTGCNQLQLSKIMKAT